MDIFIIDGGFMLIAHHDRMPKRKHYFTTEAEAEAPNHTKLMQLTYVDQTKIAELAFLIYIT